MKKLETSVAVVAVLAAIISLMLTILMVTQTNNIAAHKQPAQAVSVSAVTNPKLPNTLAGYKKAFAGLSAYKWGGGDVAVTTVLKDGRAVWFFGDTLTRRSGTLWLNRNTALVQTGMKMHSANDGVQIIPTSKKYVYWPVKVQETRPGLLIVWTSKIAVGHVGPWDFKRVNPSRALTALVSINKAGDMKFVRWNGWMTNPTDAGAAPKDGSDLRIIGPGHYGYQKITHYDLPLIGGKHLVTESQNWDNGHYNTIDYRPILSSK